MVNPSSLAKRPPNFESWFEQQYETAVAGAEALGYKPRHCPDIDELAEKIDTTHEEFLMERYIPDESAQLIFVQKRWKTGFITRADDSFIHRHGELQQQKLGVPFNMTDGEQKAMSNYETIAVTNCDRWKRFRPVFALLDKKPPQLAESYHYMNANQTIDDGLVYEEYHDSPEMIRALITEERIEQDGRLAIKQMSFREYVVFRSLMLATGGKLPDRHSATIFPDATYDHSIGIVGRHVPLDPLIARTAVGGALKLCFAPIDSVDVPVGARRILEIPDVVPNPTLDNARHANLEAMRARQE